MSRALIIGKGIGIAIMASMMVAAVVWGYKMTPTSEPCVSLDYTIADRDERLYLSEAELNQLLRTENLYPVGRPLDMLSLHRIEKAIAHHPMVRTAECYLTPRNEVHVRLTQRVPLLRVQVPTEAYFVDTDRRVMPVRAAVQDEVLLVTGNAGIQFASSALANFALWQQENTYWSDRIKRVHVVNPHMLVLHLTDTQIPPVVIGDLRGYEKKLKKLRTFLEDGVEETADKHYTELDIRYRGQVIGRR